MRTFNLFWYSSARFFKKLRKRTMFMVVAFSLISNFGAEANGENTSDNHGFSFDKYWLGMTAAEFATVTAEKLKSCPTAKLEKTVRPNQKIDYKVTGAKLSIGVAWNPEFTLEETVSGRRVSCIAGGITKLQKPKVLEWMKARYGTPAVVQMSPISDTALWYVNGSTLVLLETEGIVSLLFMSPVKEVALAQKAKATVEKNLNKEIDVESFTRELKVTPEPKGLLKTHPPETAAEERSNQPIYKIIIDYQRDAAMAGENHRRAAIFLTKMRDYIPANFDYIEKLAYQDRCLGDLQTAELRFYFALAVDPGNGETWCRLAELEAIRKNEDKAAGLLIAGAKMYKGKTFPHWIAETQDPVLIKAMRRLIAEMKKQESSSGSPDESN